jgi:hypothetical protein
MTSFPDELQALPKKQSVRTDQRDKERKTEEGEAKSIL